MTWLHDHFLAWWPEIVVLAPIFGLIFGALFGEQLRNFFSGDR